MGTYDKMVMGKFHAVVLSQIFFLDFFSFDFNMNANANWMCLSLCIYTLILLSFGNKKQQKKMWWKTARQQRLTIMKTLYL